MCSLILFNPDVQKCCKHFSQELSYGTPECCKTTCAAKGTSHQDQTRPTWAAVEMKVIIRTLKNVVKAGFLILTTSTRNLVVVEIRCIIGILLCVVMGL